MPKCALCTRENVNLMQSHIIPKLVYKRIRSHPQSRFRDLSQINKPLQDGEKYPMLCHDCEEKFSAFETNFANDFIDPYLKSAAIPKINPNAEWLSNYCLSVTWRILYDDLYRLNSYEAHWARSVFEKFEYTLHQHLNADIVSGSKPLELENYIFKLSDIVKGPQYPAFLKSMIYGYSYFDATNQIFVVYASYAGLIFATRFFPLDFFIMDLDSKANFLGQIFMTRKRTMIDSLKREIMEQAADAAIQYREAMTPELRERIKAYYKEN